MVDAGIDLTTPDSAEGEKLVQLERVRNQMNFFISKRVR